jgi:hypothetical protein
LSSTRNNGASASAWSDRLGSAETTLGIEAQRSAAVHWFLDFDLHS